MGEYQFQDMTSDEKLMYIPILKKVFPNFNQLAKTWLKGDFP